jgi:glycosyltransferase involved in cell wall biosynthesis
MRVLHLGAGNLYGGIESLLITLARERHACPEMEPSYVLCFQRRLSEELTACAVPVYQMGAVRFSRPWTVWQARRRLSALLSRERFDVAVCHECWPHVLFAPVLRHFGVRAAFFAHGGHEGNHWLERLARRTRPDIVLANSRWTQSLVGSLFPGVHSQVIHLPVPDGSPPDRRIARCEVRAELGTSDDAVVIIQVSRLERWKGHAVLLEGLERLVDVPAWECWIIGGPQRPQEECYLAELRKRATSLGLDGRVRFLGQRLDVPRLLAAADIHCQPNTGPEPFGIAFVEALFAGLPVVTTAFGGALEIIDETCGRLVPAGNSLRLTQTLRMLIEQRERRLQLSEGGRPRARQLCESSTALRHLCEVLTADDRTCNEVEEGDCYARYEKPSASWVPR